MNPVHFNLYGDISGWLSRDTSGSDRVTSAAVAVCEDSAAELRAYVAQRFSKWGRSSLADAAEMVDLLCRSAAGVAVCSFVKAQPAWEEFWNAAKLLQAAIVKQDRSAAGFVKPANAACYALFNHAFTVAMSRAVVARQSRCRRGLVQFK